MKSYDNIPTGTTQNAGSTKNRDFRQISLFNADMIQDSHYKTPRATLCDCDLSNGVTSKNL